MSDQEQHFKGEKNQPTNGLLKSGGVVEWWIEKNIVTLKTDTLLNM